MSYVSLLQSCVQLLDQYCLVVMAQNFFNHLAPNGHFSGRSATLTSRCCIFLFIQQIYVMNILNMLHNLFFFSSSKCRLFHNATFFRSVLFTFYI